MRKYQYDTSKKQSIKLIKFKLLLIKKVLYLWGPFKLLNFSRRRDMMTMTFCAIPPGSRCPWHIPQVSWK